MAFRDRLSGLPGQIAQPELNPRLPWLAHLRASRGPRVLSCWESQFFRRPLALRLFAQSPRRLASLSWNPTSGSIPHLAHSLPPAKLLLPRPDFARYLDCWSGRIPRMRLSTMFRLRSNELYLP